MATTLAIGQAFWIAAPVIVTGVLHMVIVKKDLFARLKVPVDGGRTLGGKPIFGENKTWRGVLFMTAVAALLGAAQGAAFGAWAASAGAAPLDFADIGAPNKLDQSVRAFASGYALVNAVLGLGYALGELPNSFLKRRIGIVPGKTGSGIAGVVFFILDQADSVIVALGLAALIFGLSGEVFLAGVVSLSAFHALVNGALYVARIRRNL